MNRIWSNICRFSSVQVIFKLKDNSLKKVQAQIGKNILDIARANDLDVEGACDASLACSTCHVILQSNLFNKLEPASEEEEDLLDMAFGLTETSRLGCQVYVDKTFENTVITLPKATRNFYVDGHTPKPH